MLLVSAGLLVVAALVTFLLTARDTAEKPRTASTVALPQTPANSARASRAITRSSSAGMA